MKFVALCLGIASILALLAPEALSQSATASLEASSQMRPVP